MSTESAKRAETMRRTFGALSSIARSLAVDLEFLSEAAGRDDNVELAENVPSKLLASVLKSKLLGEGLMQLFETMSKAVIDRLKPLELITFVTHLNGEQKKVVDELRLALTDVLEDDDQEERAEVVALFNKFETKVSKGGAT